MHIQHINIKNVYVLGGAGVVERIAGVRQRDQIPVAKLPAVITGLKQYAEEHI